MKYSIDLLYKTSDLWTKTVLENFSEFLQDHADCERKASAMAMSFVAKCPDKVAIIPELIETALEELEHFQQVYTLMNALGITLKSEMPPDIYMQKLIALCRSGREERTLDRFLIASIVECRGAERFKLVAEAYKDTSVRDFYKALWISEAKHGNIYIKMMLNYYPEDLVYSRLKVLTKCEAEICESLPLRPALH